MSIPVENKNLSAESAIIAETVIGPDSEHTKSLQTIVEWLTRGIIPNTREGPDLSQVGNNTQERSSVPAGFTMEIFKQMRLATNNGFDIHLWVQHGRVEKINDVINWIGLAHRPDNLFVAGITNSHGFQNGIPYSGPPDLHQDLNRPVSDPLTNSSFLGRYERASEIVRGDHMVLNSDELDRVFTSIIAEYFITAQMIGALGNPLSAFIQPAMFGTNPLTNRSLRFFQKWVNGQIIPFFKFDEGSEVQDENIQETYFAIQELNLGEFENELQYEFSVKRTDVWGKPFIVTVEFTYLPDVEGKYTASFTIDRNPSLEA